MNQNQFSQIPYIWWKLVRAYNINGNTVNINHAEIALLSILDNLGKGVKDGGGYASNEYLAECINVKPRTITKYLSELEDVALIKTFHSREKGSHITTLRKVYVQHKFISDLIDEMMADEQPIQDEGSTSTNVKVLHEAVAQTCTSSSTNVSKHLHECEEALAQTCRSTSTNVLPNITRIQQEYNTSITVNNSVPKLTSASSSKEKAVEEKPQENFIPDEAYGVGSIYMTSNSDEVLTFRGILVNECVARGVDLAKLSRHWLRIFGDRDAKGVSVSVGTNDRRLSFLEIVCGLIRHLGFKSLTLRQKESAEITSFLVFQRFLFIAKRTPVHGGGVIPKALKRVN